MKPFLFSAAVVYFSVALVCAAPFSVKASQSQSQSQSDAAKPATQSPTSTTTQTSTPASADQDKDKQDKTKKKPKKVWTNEEISTVSGGISVVGDSSASSSAPSSGKSAESDSSGGTGKDRQVAAYRDQIQKLRAQIDAADKKINDLRNFKADNTSPTGGININKGYNMTPLEDQVKQLEEQKKQIQAKIDALEDEARKNGIEAGELR
jgi:hypothetical protein